MSLSPRAVLTLTSLLAASGVLFALLLGTGSKPATAQGIPTQTSDNIEKLADIPGTIAISGVFSRTAPYFYVSGLNRVAVIDVSNPREPKQVGTLNNAVFENEAMTAGERRLPDGKIQRFVLVGNDLFQTEGDPRGIERGFGAGGRELIIVDVTDPAKPAIIGRTPTSEAQGGATTSTHTVACMNADCTVAYSAGDEEGFSIFDLSDLTQPRQVKTVKSPAGQPNPVFSTGGGHHWQVDGAGVAWHTGAGGTAAFDITDPLNPQPLNGTDANGIKSPYNDFIHHNSQRPNARAFRPGQAPSVTNGNVALVTEEDYANDGDELVCERSGSFQTWEVPSLDGAAYQAANPKRETGKGTMRVLDTIQAPAEAGGGLSAPAGAFCSAHWFDYHQSGTIAMGHYQAGLRLIDVRNARDLKQTGFATGGGTEVWDAYWVPQRDANGTVVPGRKTNIVYTVDAIRGVEAFEVKNLPPDLPVTGDDGGRGTFPSSSELASAKCGAPTSAFLRSSRVTRSGLRLRGTAAGAGCEIRQVRVAVGRKTGSRCRFLRSSGRFGAPRSCLRTQYLRARGTRRWSLTKRARLPRGSYLVWSRAIDSAGTIERKAQRRNLLRSAVR
jgi:hypothetical protein